MDKVKEINGYRSLTMYVFFVLWVLLIALLVYSAN